MSKVKMPEVAAGATHAVISRWLVNEGTEVAIGQQIVEIETDKAVVEYAAEEAGPLTKILAQAGEEVAVGDPIAVIGEDSEAHASPASQPATPVEPATPAPPVATPVAEAPASPAAVKSEEKSDDRIAISPIARKLARENELELETLQGTGPGGRIVRRDVEAALSAPPPAAAPQAAAPTSKEIASQDYSSSYSGRPHSSMRKAIARRLTESKSTVPHFYLEADCQVDQLMELRAKVNEASSIKISVNDFVVRAVAAAFMEVPEANVVWTPDQMLHYESVDLSIAVATDGGLLTPVLRGVEKRSLSSIAMTIRDLAERSRAGKLRQDELEGGSFAITNLGMYGTQSFAAIINPPQSGILAVGAASPRPIVVDGEIAVRQVMSVTLSADHRAVDGALAAQWLAAFKKYIENPLSMLV